MYDSFPLIWNSLPCCSYWLL